MEPELVDQPDPQTPLVIDHGDRISEAPSPETPGVDLSELEQHKRARGYTKAEKVDAKPTIVNEPIAEPQTVEPSKKEAAKPDQWLDPDTGDKYDMRHKVARRIKKVLEERGEERKAREAVQAKYEALLQQQAMSGRSSEPAKPQGDPNAEPDPSDTTKYPEGQYDRAYVRDMALWAADRKTKEALGTMRTEREFEARQAADTQAITAWQQTVPEAKKRYPDFEEALGNIPHTPANAPIVDMMMSSPVGNDLAYVLGTRPDLMDAYTRAPSDRLRERLLDHLEAQLLAQRRGQPKETKPETTTAPAPIAPVHAGTGAPGVIDWSRTDDPDQYQRWKQTRQARR